ncbi:hypothetical protein [Mesorhizobium sp. SP-1A]|nr:hypothetical protein [Mesorhizobium sp. SP-1A]
MENIDAKEIEYGFDWDIALQALVGLSLGALFMSAIIKALLI